jgi:uncharacterized Zn finger protein
LAEQSEGAMMELNNWEHFFKPEVRSAGVSLFNKGKVAVSQPSDTEIVIYVRATPGFKVIFKTASVESQAVNVSCTCPIAKKGSFCKHVWAGLLACEDKHSDFFESKTEIEVGAAAAPKVSAASTAQSAAYAERQAAYKEKQAAYNQKQNEYRKEQYQKMKQRQKGFKESKKTGPPKPEYPSPVKRALSFFSDNGIELSDALNDLTVRAAKKKLARVFHPDRGGAHEEIVELNACTEILINYISTNHDQK